MKIGLVTHEYPPDIVGGVSLHMFLLAQGFAERGHTVHVITLGTETDTVRQDGAVTVHRVLHHSLYSNKGRLRESLRRIEFSLAVLSKVRALLGEKQVEVLQADPMGGDLFLFSLQSQDRIPMVTHLSTMYRDLTACEEWTMNADLQLSAWMEDEIIMRSQRVIAPSRACAQRVAHRLGIDPHTIRVIPHGISLPEQSPSMLQAMNSAPPAPHVLFVGRLERRKGIQTLIQAIPRVLARMPEATFSLMGADSYAGAAELARDGSAETSFKQQLLLELPHRYWSSVRFLGLCDAQARERILAACDVFVAPSLYESFGFVYLEAMAHGKPVVGCRVGGVPEVVEDGASGLLIPPDDPQALAEAMLRLLADHELRHRMGLEGRRAVETRFSISQMVEQTLAVYDDVLQRAA